MHAIVVCIKDCGFDGEERTRKLELVRGSVVLRRKPLRNVKRCLVKLSLRFIYVRISELEWKFCKKTLDIVNKWCYVKSKGIITFKGEGLF